MQAQNTIFYKFIKKILIDVKGKDVNTLNIKKLLNFDINVQIILVRSWLNINKIIMPTLNQINHIYVEIILSNNNTNAIFYTNNILVKKYNNNLYLLKKKKYSKKYYNFKTRNFFTNILKKYSIYNETKYQNSIKLKFKTFTRNIKKYMQKKNIPPWKRKFIPLIFNKNNFINLLCK